MNSNQNALPQSGSSTSDVTPSVFAVDEHISLRDPLERWRGHSNSDTTTSPASRPQDFCGAHPAERRGRGFGQIPKREHEPHAGVRRALRLLVAESEPPIGAHIVTRRHGYAHHGIYAGVGRVVHYAGLSRGLHRGPVEEISLSRFAAGRRVSVVTDMPPNFEGPEVARRARSRIGEDNYRLLTNNCEHFCEWCLRGQHRSYQIDAWLAFPSRALHVTRRLFAPSRSFARRTAPHSALASAKP
jgi:hypothetical protein